jgi:hypothetical protein
VAGFDFNWFIEKDGVPFDEGSGAAMTLTPPAPGSYTVTLTATAQDGATSNPEQVSITVLPAAPTFSVSATGRIYNGSPFGATGSAVGIDGATPVTGSWAYTYYPGNTGSGTPLASPPTQAGTYTVFASFTSSDPNYTGGSAQSVFTIAPATPTVAGSAGGTYTGSPVTAQVVATGVDGTTRVAGQWTYTYYAGSRATGTPLPGAPTQAGTYTVVVSFTSSDPNYTNVGPSSIAANIARAVPLVSVTAGGSYTGQALAAIATVTGVKGVNLGTPTLVYYNGSTASGTPLSDAPTAVGTYTVVASFAGSDSYTSATAQTTFVIAQAAVSFNGLHVSRTVHLGTASVVFAGHLSVPGTLLLPAAGETVTLTIGGIVKTVKIDRHGKFSITFNTHKLKRGTYVVAYSYSGDASLAAATDDSTTLTIR